VPDRRGPARSGNRQRDGNKQGLLRHPGVELVKGVDLACPSPQESRCRARVLVVICDGHRQEHGRGKGQMTALKARAAGEADRELRDPYKGAMAGRRKRDQRDCVPQTRPSTPPPMSRTRDQRHPSRLGERQLPDVPGFDPQLGLGLSWPPGTKLILKSTRTTRPGRALTLAPHMASTKPGFVLLVIEASPCSAGSCSCDRRQGVRPRSDSRLPTPPSSIRSSRSPVGGSNRRGGRHRRLAAKPPGTVQIDLTGKATRS